MKETQQVRERWGCDESGRRCHVFQSDQVKNPRKGQIFFLKLLSKY